MAHDDGEVGDPDAPGGPVPLEGRRRPPLTPRQRLWVVAAAVAPVAVLGVGLVPAAVVGGFGAGDVVAGAVVYGGLVGLAAAFVAVDRVHARQCPRCGYENDRQAASCERCAYDVARRPRFACTERHRVYVDPGRCHCGRRLQELPVARGLRRELVVALKLGGGLLAFLLVVGVALRVLEG